VVRPESAGLVQHNPFIDLVIPYDKYGSDKGLSGILRVAKKLRGFDKAIIVQRYFRTALIPFLANIKARIGYNNSKFKFLYTEIRNYNPKKHEVIRCLNLAGINENLEKYHLRIVIDKVTDLKVSETLARLGIVGDFAVIAPGSIWPTKRYNQFGTLADLIAVKLLLPVVMLGGRGDITAARNAIENSRAQIYALTGNTALLESASVISKARIVFSNDSAPAHMAAAVNTPVVVIMGPTVQSFGFAPYTNKSKIAEVNNLYCRPCSSHGSNKCPENHFRCMTDLSPHLILGKAKSILGG